MVENELTWTTWEELLLGCAVKRHGHKDWHSVAMELQNRSSLPLLLTAQVCENKYYDLKRRFMDTTDHGHDGSEEVDAIPWLEELRKLRVAELKQEVQRYDLSIQSLQLKVKRLEEERERSLKENENDDEKPDLEKDLKEVRSENEKNDGTGAPGHAAVESSDRENRSFNESNSTENREAAANERREPVGAGDGKPDPASSDSKPAGADSYNDSSDTVAKQAAEKSSREKKGGDLAELRDLAGESKEGTKESSDVQSTASLTRKRHREKEVSGWSSGGGGDEPVVSPATIQREAVKSEPLVGLLDIIRSHKHGSMFERRLESQKTEEYKSMIRQHVDLETIRTRLDEGSYCSCSTKFHRDLLLLFNNAVVFFPKGSPESVAANELRDLTLKEMKKKKTQRYDSSPEPESAPSPSKPNILQPKSDPETSVSLLAKHKSSVPLIVCRKRSSISAKTPEKQTNEKQKPTLVNPNPNPKPSVKTSANVNEEQRQSPMKVKTKEKPVTGTRSLRRSSSSSSKGHTDNRTPNKINHQMITNPGSNSGSADKGEAPKTDKKKTDITVKKQGAADFLKRIKRNSPSKGTVLNPNPNPNPLLKSKGSAANGVGRKEQKKRGEGKKEALLAPSKRSGGAGSGKRVKEESSPSKRGVGRPPKNGKDAGGTKRGREGGGGDAEVGSKRSKKRSRR